MSAVFRGKKVSKASIAEAGLLGAQIMSATSELRGKSDTELNMKVARKLADLSKRAAILKGSSMKKAQAAIYLIAKQLNSDEIGTVVLVLDLVDVVMKHSNSETYNLLANDRNYMAMLKELCMTQRKGINVISHFTPEFVQRKTLIMVQRWGIELSPMTIVRSSRVVSVLGSAFKARTKLDFPAIELPAISTFSANAGCGSSNKSSR